MSKLTFFTLLAIFLFVVLGCKTISDLADSNGKSTGNEKPNTVSNNKNKLVGTWVGKSADNSTDLKMIFTESDWTLYSDGKMVAGTQKYNFKDDETIEVETRQGAKFPMKVSVNGNTLTVIMKDSKITMRREA